MNLILMQRGYLVVNIAGDTESRLAYYNALEKRNLEDDKIEFIELIAGYVLKIGDVCAYVESGAAQRLDFFDKKLWRVRNK
ncbi:hypothetical protein ADUPG1_001897 [Aduncisulcus paluster]|uniref:Uncharacterized protein n=1 Tax=Aduncisulcus paluster TaxID=2918883 RepID=A0ABQ5KF96_9EUKA|nr:hypothetical protein ADUPG1_001897 [Aduncisulcus paluster]